jgi:serine/threonine protein kinase
MCQHIWGIAATAMEMAEGKPPDYGYLPMTVQYIPSALPPRLLSILTFTRDLLIAKVLSRRPKYVQPPTLKEPTKWSPQFNDFLSLCLKHDPKQRPSFHDLLKVWPLLLLLDCL